MEEESRGGSSAYGPMHESSAYGPMHDRCIFWWNQGVARSTPKCILGKE